MTGVDAHDWEAHDGREHTGCRIGLPVGQVRPALNAALAGADGSHEVRVEATNRRGRAITCRVTCSPLVGGDDTVRGVIMVTEEWPRTNGP